MQGVYIGSGIGSLDDAYNTAVEFEKGVRQMFSRIEDGTLTPPQGYKKVSPLFVPRLLINLAAGHISMRYGFKVRVTSLKIMPDRLGLTVEGP